MCVSCFLILFLPFYLFVHNFTDNYVSCHVFLVSSRVCQLLSRVTETKTIRKEANRQKQETESKERIVDESLHQKSQKNCKAEIISIIIINIYIYIYIYIYT